jgi:hypothetical protein
VDHPAPGRGIPAHDALALGHADDRRPFRGAAQEDERALAGRELRHAEHRHLDVAHRAAGLHDAKVRGRRTFPGLDHREVDRREDALVVRVPSGLHGADVDDGHLVGLRDHGREIERHDKGRLGSTCRVRRPDHGGTEQNAKRNPQATSRSHGYELYNDRTARLLRLGGPPT